MKVLITDMYHESDENEKGFVWGFVFVPVRLLARPDLSGRGFRAGFLGAGIRGYPGGVDVVQRREPGRSDIPVLR